MKKKLGILVVFLLVLLQACNKTDKPKDPTYNSEYYIYHAYDLTKKDELVKLDYHYEGYYLKFNDQVSLSIGEYKFSGEYKTNNLLLSIDDLEFVYNKDKTLIEIVYNDKLLIFKKSNIEISLDVFEKTYSLDNKEEIELHFYKDQNFKLAFNNGDFPISINGKYFNFTNYIVISYESYLKLVEKHDSDLMIYYTNQGMKLNSDGLENLDEKLVNKFTYVYDVDVISELAQKIEKVTKNDQYILSEELLTNSTKTKLYSYPEYKYLYTKYDESLYYENQFFMLGSDGYRGSYSTAISSVDFFKELNDKYLIYQKDENTFYLSISYNTFSDNEYRSQLLSDYLYYNKSHLYYEIIFDDISFEVNIYNDNNLNFFNQKFEEHDLADIVDLNNIEQVSALNLSDALFPVIMDKEYNVQNSVYKKYNSYFKIDFNVGYYTIETSKIEKYQFLNDQGEDIYLHNVFSEVEYIDSNYNGYLMSFYVSQPVTYYLRIDLKPYGSAPYYDYSFKIRHFESLDLEMIEFEFNESLVINVDDIFFAKKIELSFSLDKVLYIQVEALGERLHFQIQKDGSMSTGSYINKSFEGSLVVLKDSNYSLVFRESAIITIKEGYDDEYLTDENSPFDLENYNNEIFVAGETFSDDYFTLTTLDNLYQFSTSTYVSLEITNQKGEIIKGNYDYELLLYVYLLSPEDKFSIKVSSNNAYIEYYFNIKTIPTGKITIDSFPYNNNVYFDQETSIEFTLNSQSLIYFKDGYGSLDLWSNDERILLGVEDIAIVLDIGTYKLKPNFDYVQFIEINIIIINNNTNKISFNKGITLTDSINLTYQFEHGKEVFRIITKSNEKLNLNVEGTAKYYVKKGNQTSYDPLRYGLISYVYGLQDIPLEIYAKGDLDTLTTIKLSNR